MLATTLEYDTEAHSKGLGMRKVFFMCNTLKKEKEKEILSIVTH